MGYKAELKKLHKNRAKYYPVLKRFAETVTERGTELSSDSDIFVILELIDVGYLNREAFSVHRAFNTVDSVRCVDDNLLTYAGREFLRSYKKPRSISPAFIAALILACIVVSVFFAFKFLR